MASKSKIDWYARYATEHLVTATDSNGLYCEVISENIEGMIYRVNMDDKIMTDKSCHYKPCKHMRIATHALAPNVLVVTCEVEAGQWYIIDHNQQVWAHDGQWYSIEKAMSYQELKQFLTTFVPRLSRYDETLTREKRWITGR